MSHYPNLEPNHRIDEDEFGIDVVCPFEQTEAGLVLHDHPVTYTCTWARSAEPEEVNCLACEVLNGKLHYAGSPDCEGTGEWDEE